MGKKRILILGCGVSGLSVAWNLAQKSSEYECIILEKSEEPGGYMGSKLEEGFLVEKGPRVFKTSRNAALLEVVSQVGFDSKIIPSSASSNSRFLLLGGKLQKMPTGLLSLLTSKISRPLLVSLVHEWKILPVMEDETIWDFACRRFGVTVAERFFDPLVLGIYAGDIKKLSVESCFPLLKKWEREKGSILKGCFSSLFKRKGKKKKPLISSPLFSFEGGSGAFIKKWASELPFQIHYGEEILSLSLEGDLWKARSLTKTWEGDFVFLALPAYASSKILQEAAPETSSLLHSFYYQDVTTLHMGWKEDVLPFSAFGYLVPRKEKEPVLGVLFDSKIFKKEDDSTLITVMIEGVFHSSEELAQIAERVSMKHLGVFKKPSLLMWEKNVKAIPQYYVGHQEKKKSLLAALEKETTNAFLVGSYLDGVSVNDCIKSAKEKVCSYF